MEPQQFRQDIVLSGGDSSGISIDKVEDAHLQLVLAATHQGDGSQDDLRMSAPLARALLAELAVRDEIMAELRLCRSDVETALSQLDLMVSQYSA